MNELQKAIVGIGLIVLAGLALFPPWHAVSPNPIAPQFVPGQDPYPQRDFHPAFEPPYPSANYSVWKIDLGKLTSRLFAAGCLIASLYVFSIRPGH